MATSATKFKRGSKYVSHDIQGRMIRSFAMYWFVYHAALWHIMFVWEWLQLNIAMLGTNEQVSVGLLYLEFMYRHAPFLLCSLLVFPCVAFDLVRFTHRVAGPLIRFRNTLNAMAKGEPVRKIKLRKGDLLTELQDSFNNYLEAVDYPEPGDDKTANSKSTKGKELDERELDELAQAGGQVLEPSQAR
ncbi:hypothetical protein [Calycomorphotria hydatis]|uniref:HAMP domain-containing protein n=1 Tax=Calycomorphotria hydatis TaxID=2528027 RepID=A0A517T7P1_9PLAN|nr:hypothetical protein [Calycomorphotria hydatis]QDT64394.1 hypothetical protein V22_16280 [Calycomorphotria hydatis]